MGSDAITQIHCLQEVNNVINALGGGVILGLWLALLATINPQEILNKNMQVLSSTLTVVCSFVNFIPRRVLSMHNGLLQGVCKLITNNSGLYFKSFIQQ